jgi:hypothetical protein
MTEEPEPEEDSELETNREEGGVQAPKRRGRRPGSKNKSKAASSARATPSSAPSLNAELKSIQKDIAQDLARIGMLATMVAPVTGLVVANRADRASTALCILASKNPALLNLLRMAAAGGVYAELGFIVGDVVIALGVERGAIPVDSFLTSTIRPEIAAAQEAARVQQEAYAAQQAAAGEPEYGAGGIQYEGVPTAG